jgi:hypothetical protein
MSSAQADFFCSKCKKPYRWYPEYAGKVAQCVCGGVIQFPLLDPHPRDPLSIAFLPRDLPETHSGPAPSELGPPPGEVEAAPTLAAHGLSLYAGEDPTKKEEMRNAHIPFLLMGASLFLLGWTIAAESAPLITTLIIVGISLLIEIGIMLFGMSIAAHVMNINLGPAKQSLYKLTALYLAPAALMMLIANFFGDDAVMSITYFAGSMVLYWFLLAYLFRLNGWQTLACVICIGVIKFIVRMCIITAVISFVLSQGIAKGYNSGTGGSRTSINR